MNALRDLFRRGPVHTHRLGYEFHGLFMKPELEESEQRVQSVGVLVVLGAEGVDQAAGAVQFASQPLQLGAVAQGDDGAAVIGWHAVRHQYTLAADGKKVGAGHPAGQYVRRAARGQGLVQGAAGVVRTQVEQSLRLVVHQADPAVLVERDETLTYAVQHRLALGEQSRDVGEGQVVGAALKSTGDEIGSQRAYGERAARVREELRNGGEQPFLHALVGNADGHRADDLAILVAQRNLAPGGAAEGAVVDLHDLLA